MTSGVYARPSPEARFWKNVERVDGGCWLWRGSLDAYGYGAFYAGQSTGAHRFAYQVLVGPIPGGRQIDHLCRVRCCVNPAHLELVTVRENVLRGVGHTAINAAKTHCIAGHEFGPENTKIRANGSRLCRKCQRSRRAGYRAARRKEKV